MLACCDTLSAKLGRLVLQNRLPVFPPHRATVFRCVISRVATAMKLFPLDRASTGGVGVPTCDAQGCEVAVMLRVSKALAKLAV